MPTQDHVLKLDIGLVENGKITMDKFLIPVDKANHFIAGAIASGIAILFVPVLYAFLITAIIGATKELYDLFSETGTPDLNDLLFTIAGSIPVLISHL